MAEILLIHDISDADVVDRLAEEIAKAGVAVAKFESEHLNDGVPREFAATRAVIVVWSPRSVRSDFVRRCADMAMLAGNLIALRTHDLDPSEILERFRQPITPLVDDWVAIGNAISAKFEAEGRDGAGTVATEIGPTAQAPATAQSNEARAAAMSVQAAAAASQPPPLPPMPVAAAAVAPPVQSAVAAATAASPASAPAPAAAQAPPAKAHVKRPDPLNRPEGIGAASDGPSRIFEQAWRLERERPGTSVTFGKPMAPPVKPASLSFDELQRARGAAQGSTDRPRAPASLSDVFPDPDVVVDDVDCSVFAPPVARIGARIMVQVFLHRIEQAERAQFLAETMDDTAKLRGMETLQLPISRRTRVTVELDGRGLKVSEPMRSLLWHGQPTVAAFEVEVPQDFDGEVCHPVARVLVEGEPVGRILFQIRIEPATRDAKPLPGPAPELGGTSAKPYQYAFLSYASKDRAEVLKRAQAFQAAKLEFFQDVLSLEPGQRYSDEILHKIGKADLFVLFWSRHANRSEWVRKEIDHALACQRNDPSGLPDIVPIMLESIAKAPPLPGLADLHHNAPINTLIAAEQPSLLRRIKEWLFG